MSDPADIRAWQRLSPDVTTSGRIEERDIARLAAIGVRHVINLAMADHPEALGDEEAKLAVAGIGYTHIPVPFDAPEPSHYRAFATALQRACKPVHVHCIANFRVSAFFYLYHRQQGMDDAAAQSLMEQHWSPNTVDHPSSRVWGEWIRHMAGEQG